MRVLVLAGVILGALAQCPAAAQTAQPVQRQYPPPPAIVQPPDPKAPRKLDSFGDKVTRCLHHGGSIGVPNDQLGQYTRECAHSQ